MKFIADRQLPRIFSRVGVQDEMPKGIKFDNHNVITYAT